MFHPSHVTPHSVQRVQFDQTNFTVKCLLVALPLSLGLGLTQGKPGRKSHTLHLLHLCRVNSVAGDLARILDFDGPVMVRWSKPRFLIFDSGNLVIARPLLFVSSSGAGAWRK